MVFVQINRLTTIYKDVSYYTHVQIIVIVIYFVKCGKIFYCTHTKFDKC